MHAMPYRIDTRRGDHGPDRGSARRLARRDGTGRLRISRRGALFPRAIAHRYLDRGQTALLRDLCDTMKHGSLCPLGGFPPYPVLIALDHFPADFGPPAPVRPTAEQIGSADGREN